MALTADRVQFTTATTGTGPISDGPAVDATFVSASNAGLIDGAPYSLVILDATAMEMLVATWNATGQRFERVATLRSTNGNAALNLSGSARVFLTALAADIAQPSVVDTLTTVGVTPWARPAGLRLIFVQLASGGAGGGSGRKGAAGTARVGGGGGAGGQIVEGWFPASSLPAIVNVTVGAGGAGGAAVTANSTNGNAGSAGGATLFGTLLRTFVSGPAGGAGGQQGAGGTGGGTVGYSLHAPGAGQSASTTGGAGVPNNQSVGCPGGAAGGGITTADVAGNGAQGGGNTRKQGSSGGGSTGGGAGGVVDGSLPGNGTDNAPGELFGGYSGGSGAASKTMNAQDGGAGGNPGAGGSGGGAALDGVGNSGAGGKGGDGRAVVIRFY